MTTRRTSTTDPLAAKVNQIWHSLENEGDRHWFTELCIQGELVSRGHIFDEPKPAITQPVIASEPEDTKIRHANRTTFVVLVALVAAVIGGIALLPQPAPYVAAARAPAAAPCPAVEAIGDRVLGYYDDMMYSMIPNARPSSYYRPLIAQALAGIATAPCTNAETVKRMNTAMAAGDTAVRTSTDTDWAKFQAAYGDYRSHLQLSWR